MTCTPITDAIADLDGLLAAVMRDATHRASSLHGPQHWQAVARVGAQLIEAGEPASPAVVFAFALIHDHRRLDDGFDPDHGPRAAERLAHLAPWLRFSDTEFDALRVACATHTGARRSDDPTVGVCFDADRLNLWRVCTWPDPQYLSCPSARDENLIAACCAAVFDGCDWRELYERYAALDRAPARR